MATSEVTKFWELIAQDHLQFIYHALGKNEVHYIEVVKSIFTQFDDDVDVLLQQTLELKKELLAKKIKGEVVLDLTPTFINHMINEAEAGLMELTGQFDVQVLFTHKL